MGTFDLPDDIDPRAVPDDAARAALAREAIPTLAEVMAADRWVTLADGGIVPVRLDRGDAGWGADEDRDSAMAQALSGHVKRMDDLSARWRKVSATYPTRTECFDLARDMASTWAAIRKITRENGGR